MKKFTQKLILTLLFGTLFFNSQTFAQTDGNDEIVLTNKSSAHADSGAFWFRKWDLAQPKGIDLKTVSNFDSSLLLTFSGADFTYLNKQAATSVKKIDGATVEWNFSDAKVDYKKTFHAEDEFVTVAIEIKFKEKAPEKAYLNLVSKGGEDDPEKHDRNLVYFTDNKIVRLAVNDKIDSTEVVTTTKWVGAESRYFILAVLPEALPEKLLVQSTGDKIAQASLQLPIQNNQLVTKFKVAFIPKELNILRKVDPSLDTTINLGFFTFVAYPILWLLKYIFSYVGNYGIAIIILTIFIKILTFPLTLKSVKGMRKMSEFQPKMKALQERYKNDKEALNREMMLMMKGSGYNPMAGCFPMLIQMPVFFALYSVLYAAVELYRAPFALWITDLSLRDPYYITPILMTLVMFLQQKLSPPAPGMDPTQQKVMQFMPLMFGAFMVTTPSGLCLYMLVNATVSILQQLYLNKKLGVPGHVAGAASI